MDFDVEYAAPTNATYLSARREPHVANLNVPNPLGGLDGCHLSFKYLVEEAEDLYEENFITVDQLPLVEEYKEVFKEVEKIVNYDYMPMPVREKQGEISLAMAAPAIGFMKAEMASSKHGLSVLVLGAGVGKDLIRVMNAFRGEIFFTCVEPFQKACNKMRQLFPKADVCSGTLSENYDKIKTKGPFDFVIANMSIHYMLGVASGRQSAKLISDVLVNGGQFFGSYIDVPAVKLSGDGLHMKYGHSVMYLGTDRMNTHYGEQVTNDIARIAVGGKIWRDPWLSTEQYYDIFEDTNMSLQILDGTTMLYGTGQGPLYPCPIPGFYKKPKRAELSVYRAIIGFKGKQTPSSLCDENGVPNAMREIPCDGLAMRHIGIPYNKGMALTPDDLEYIDENMCWVTEKQDGVPVKLVHSARSLEMIVEGEKLRYIKFEGFSSPYTKDFILQGELMTYTLPDKTEKQSVVVTDVLVAPWGVTGNFISRWKWLEGIFALGWDAVEKKSAWPFRLQHWWHISDPDFYSALPLMAEGLVLQSLTAPPSIVSQGAGTARYVKREYTIDVQGPVGIVEKTLDGKFVRDRPDKKVPNPPHVVARIRAAVTFDDFVTFLNVRYGNSPVIHNARRSVFNMIRDFVPIADWKPADCTYFYHHSGDAWLHRHFGPRVIHYRRVMIDRMCKEAIDKKEEEYQRHVEATDYGNNAFEEMEPDSYAATTLSEYFSEMYRIYGVKEERARDVLYHEGGNIRNARVHFAMGTLMGTINNPWKL